MFLNLSLVKETPDAKFIGGIIIHESTGNVVSFRFCLNRTPDTNDLTGWDFFGPALIFKYLISWQKKD